MGAKLRNSDLSFLKRKNQPRRCWHTALIPALGRQRRVLWVQGQPTLQREFQDNESYREKPCLTKKDGEGGILSFLYCVCMCVGGCFPCLYVCMTCVQWLRVCMWEHAFPACVSVWLVCNGSGEERPSHLLELGIQTSVSHHVGAATESEVLEKQRVLVIMKSPLQLKGTFSIPAQDFVDKIKVLKILSYFKFWTLLVFCFVYEYQQWMMRIPIILLCIWLSTDTEYSNPLKLVSLHCSETSYRHIIEWIVHSPEGKSGFARCIPITEGQQFSLSFRLTFLSAWF